jgi:two-component system, chemotaxis family, response regulator Rcp1
MLRDTVGRPMEILLVEDNLADACLTMEALREGQFEHRLTLLRDGLDALEFLRREGKYARAPRPDLILLDLELPKMDGRDMLMEIHADPDLSAVPVVVLTVSQYHEELVVQEHLDADCYMVKPIDWQGFLDLVARFRRRWAADVLLPLESR